MLLVVILVTQSPRYIWSGESSIPGLRVKSDLAENTKWVLCACWKDPLSMPVADQNDRGLGGRVGFVVCLVGRSVYSVLYAFLCLFVCLFVFLMSLTAFFRAARCTVVLDTHRAKICNSRTFVKYHFIASVLSMWACFHFTWIAWNHPLFTFQYCRFNK